MSEMSLRRRVFMNPWTFILLFSFWLPFPAPAEKVESLKEICIGRKNPRCSTVGPHRLIRRRKGRVVHERPLTARQFAAAQKAIEKYLVYASNDDACSEPVEIADFVGESLVRVQKYCASSKATKALKSSL